MKLLRSPVSVALLTALAPLSWGTTYVTITELLPADRPLLVAAMRVVPAGMVLALVGAARGELRPRGGQWRHILVLGLFNFGLFFPLLIVAIYRMPGGVAAAMGGIQPISVALITWAVTGEHPRASDLAIGAAAAAGVALVVLQRDAVIDPIGAIAAVGANVSFALGVVLTKHLGTTPRSMSATGWQLLSSSLLLVPLALLIEGAPPRFTAVNLWGFAYLSLVATGLAFVIWFAGIRNLPTPVPPLLGLAAPLTGAVLGWLLLGEALVPSQIAGIAVSVSAVGYGALLRTRRVAPTAPRDTRPGVARRLESAAAVTRLPSSPASRDCPVHPAPTSA